MKKGKQLKKVNISTNGYVIAYDNEDVEIKLSRSERNVLTRLPQKGRGYTSKIQKYVDDIIKAFGGNPEVLSSDFTVYKDGEIKFTYTKNTN